MWKYGLPHKKGTRIKKKVNNLALMQPLNCNKIMKLIAFILCCMTCASYDTEDKCLGNDPCGCGWCDGPEECTALRDPHCDGVWAIADQQPCGTNWLAYVL